MGCSKIRKKLGFYLDKALDEQSLELVEAHLAECDACRRELAAMKTLVETAGQIEPVEPPATLHASILQAIENEKLSAEPLAKVSHQISVREWLASYASPGSLRWAAGAVAVGMIALMVMIGSPREPVSTRHAAVQTRQPAQTQSDNPKPAVVAESPADEPVVKSISTDRQPRDSTSTHFRAKSHSVRRHHIVSAKFSPAALSHQKPTAVVAKVERKAVEAVVEPTTPEDAAIEVADVPKPAPNTGVDTQQPVTIRVAAAPVIDNDKIHEWMQNAKIQAEMRKGESLNTGINILSARF
ncbi:MAG: zf-HC2 domain-containing protein [Armatimonadota bacterium]|nr:zf-HC2 domain-containing protein [bacterium]